MQGLRHSQAQQMGGWIAHAPAGADVGALFPRLLAAFGSVQNAWPGCAWSSPHMALQRMDFPCCLDSRVEPARENRVLCSPCLLLLIAAARAALMGQLFRHFSCAFLASSLGIVAAAVLCMAAYRMFDEPHGVPSKGSAS